MMVWDMLNPLVTWLGATPIAAWLGSSTERVAWLFIGHLIGLVLLLGSVVLLNLHLLGLVLPHKPVNPLAKTALPVTSAGLALMVATGSLIFIGGAEPYYAGQAFRAKMVLLCLAILFHFAIFRRVVLSDRASRPARSMTAVVSLLLWFGVGCAGRWIAFS